MWLYIHSDTYVHTYVRTYVQLIHYFYIRTPSLAPGRPGSEANILPTVHTVRSTQCHRLLV